MPRSRLRAWSSALSPPACFCSAPRACAASAIARLDLVLDLALLGGELFRLALRVLDVLLRAVRLALRELIGRLPQLLERLLRRRAAVLRSVGRCAPHLIGRLLQLAREVGQLLARHVALQLLEPPRRLLHFVRELALAGAAAAGALVVRRHPPQPLGFLLLPLRELLQLLRELVDLLFGLLIARALLHLVLVRQLVELELEEIGEIVRLLRAAAAPAAALLLRE